MVDILMVIAPKDFRDEEYTIPRKVFNSNGVSVKVASFGVGQATGIGGTKVTVDLDVKDANPLKYDAIVFIGGPGTKVYFTDDVVLKLARDAANAGKITAAICIAPVILANAHILDRRNATVWSSFINNTFVDELKKGGAIYLKDNVVVDDHIITGSGPEAAEEFGKAIIDVLAKEPVET